MIIYTEHIPSKIENSICSIDTEEFEPIYGNILIVNDLWNPNLEVQDGVLLLDRDDTSVLNFVKENTKIFDESHNWQHAIKVAYNSTKILNTKFVLYLALLHDVCDHKYENAMPRKLLSEYIMNNLRCIENLEDYKEIDNLIDKISFIKQKGIKSVENEEKKENKEKREEELIAVRDGDRLEAIGEVGIIRCEQFVKLKNGKIPEDVVQHCYDKLLRLVPEGYIKSEIGRIEAIKRHNIIVDYVKRNDKGDRKDKLDKLN